MVNNIRDDAVRFFLGKDRLPARPQGNFATNRETLRRRVIYMRSRSLRSRALPRLVRHQVLLVACNDYFGIRPIKLSFQPLDTVLQRIKNLNAKSEENDNNI